MTHGIFEDTYVLEACILYTAYNMQHINIVKVP